MEKILVETIGVQVAMRRDRRCKPRCPHCEVVLNEVREGEIAGTPDGWGVSASISTTTESGFMPFLRGGWADDGGSLYEASISTGFGDTRNPGKSMPGIGLNWNRPNRSTFGPNLGDQYSLELFQRLQLTEGVEITRGVQIIRNPALNPSDDWSVFFGLRLRAAL